MAPENKGQREGRTQTLFPPETAEEKFFEALGQIAPSFRTIYVPSLGVLEYDPLGEFFT